jgi:hypothetical protein
MQKPISMTFSEALALKYGFKPAPTDHPIYSEGSSFMFSSHSRTGPRNAKPEWSVDVSDNSIIVTHQASGCRFHFSRTENIPFVSNESSISPEDGMQEPSDELFGEAMQIAIDTAADEWR